MCSNGCKAHGWTGKEVGRVYDHEYPRIVGEPPTTHLAEGGYFKPCWSNIFSNIKSLWSSNLALRSDSQLRLHISSNWYPPEKVQTCKALKCCLEISHWSKALALTAGFLEVLTEMEFHVVLIYNVLNPWKRPVFGFETRLKNNQLTLLPFA